MQKIAISQYPRGGGTLDRYLGGSSPKHNAMGYSLRDERYRLTLWRDRTSHQILAKELYDEKEDPNETVNLANKPEHQATIAALSKHLPPAPASTATASKPTTLTAEKIKEREGFFTSRDKDHDNQLSLEEFLAKQPDAKPRFTLWDTNQDGKLSHDEFVYTGGKAP